MSVFLGKAQSPEEGPGTPQSQGTFINIASPGDEETKLIWIEKKNNNNSHGD